MVGMADLVQQPGERHLLYGGSRTGKSSLMDWSLRNIQSTRPECMTLLLDTKPRFRAESSAWGPGNRWRRDASELYRGWSKGPVLPNSVVINMWNEHPLKRMWDMDRRPGEIVILQSGEKTALSRMLAIARSFVKRQVGGQERLLVVDEGLDFYQRNSLGIDTRNDVILDTARAGGERAIGLMFGAHRPHGVPPLLNVLSSRVTTFHLRYEADMKYLYNMGVPIEDNSPAEPYVFHQYVIKPGGMVSEPIRARMKYPDAYLQQLSTT